MITSKGRYYCTTVLIASLMAGLAVFNGNGLEPFHLRREQSTDVQPKGRTTNKRLAQVGEDGTSNGTTPEEKKTCVLYVGPHKTGSSSVEDFLRHNKQVLIKDNYTPYLRNAHNLATCLYIGATPGSKRYERHNCGRILLDFKSTIDKTSDKHNLLVAQEMFDRTILNVTDLMTNYLEPHYNVHVVMYYRRFYDWIHSKYNQNHKQSKNQRKLIPTFGEWLGKNMETDYRDRHTASTYKMYSSHPGIYNISVVNMHHDPANFDVVESFACGQVDGAQSLCEAFRNLPQTVHANPSWSFDWVMFRQRLKQFHSTEGLDEKDWEEIEIKFNTMVDVPKECLADGKLKDRLLQISLEAEKISTPESWYNSEEGLEALKADFEEKIKTKLCWMDVGAIVMSSEWQEFLDDLEGVEDVE